MSSGSKLLPYLCKQNILVPFLDSSQCADSGPLCPQCGS